MSTPIWIIVEDEDGNNIFEGHQGHWANCYFSNATRAEIESALEGNFLGEDIRYWISNMSPDQIAKYPEAIVVEQYLIKEYGAA